MDSDTVAKRGKLMIVGHSFVRRMSDICSSNAVYRYFCPDLLLSCMFDKVVFRGRGDLPWMVCSMSLELCMQRRQMLF